ncbi:unnamed protein product [Mytilus edulis]|uniref:B box-type domain-containing protein n=1 Tax=Mytilus edulis TaxID=6550 RepID=A0A8S3TKW8_MYTED|nr:unnamed protein product [Mytilus edulis]
MECNTPICKLCVIKKHKSHDLAEIKESTEMVKADVKTVIDMKMGNLQSKIATVDQGSNEYKADVKGVIHAIREEGTHLKELIDQKVESLVKLVKENDTKNVQTLQSDGKELKTALDKAKEQEKLYHDAQGIKDTTKLLQKLNQIKSKIDQIQETQILNMPSVKYAKRTVAESEIGNC